MEYDGGMAVAVPPPLPSSYPWWHAEYGGARAAELRAIKIPSGCSTVNGNVQCAPETMRAQAEATARATGRWSKPLSLEAYTLARYMTSEVGSGTPEEMVAVGEAAVNQARLRGYQDVNKLLVWNPGTKVANQGYYGPIHGPGGVSTAPYGRWAATSKDPHMLALLLADLVASGGSGDFARGATSQYGLEYLSDPKGKVAGHAAEGKYWVGPLAGVDHWRTFLFRQYPKTLSQADRAALLARGLWGVAQPRPVWPAGMPVEARLGLATFAVVGLSAYLAYRIAKRRGIVR